MEGRKREEGEEERARERERWSTLQGGLIPVCSFTRGGKTRARRGASRAGAAGSSIGLMENRNLEPKTLKRSPD